MNLPPAVPFSEDSEKGLLCSMILSPDALYECKGTPIGAFYIPAHNIVFQRLVEFHDQNKPIDFVLLKHSFQNSKQLEEIGGVEYLNNIWQFVPTPANWRYYLDIVLDRHHRRITIQSCQKIMASMYDVRVEMSSSIQEQAERALTQLAVNPNKVEKTFREQVLETTDELQTLSQTVTSDGAIFGIKSLDDMICGMLPAELWVLAARTSHGKSALAMQCALKTSFNRKLYTVIFSLEMEAKQVIKRMMSHEGMVSMRRMRDGMFNDTDYARLAHVTTRLVDALIQIYDDFTLDWKSVVSQCRSKQVKLAREGKSIGLIVLDYLQLIDGTGDEERKELEISNIVKSAKSLSKEMKCPVLMVAMRSDNGKLYGAASIKHHADGLLLIDPSDSDEEGRVNITLAKMRDGERDRVIPVRFYGQHMTFEAVNLQIAA